jgi:putative transposase
MNARIITRLLDQWIEKYGKPARIRTDNGPEFISHHFKKWLKHHHIEWEQIRPGQPQENAIVERFNGTYRREILDTNLFFSIDQARAITQAWMEEYNHKRPHEALQNKTPMEYEAA